MTIAELEMHYYLLLDVFLLDAFMLRKAVIPVSPKKALCWPSTEMQTQISQFLLFQREA